MFFSFPVIINLNSNKVYMKKTWFILLLFLGITSAVYSQDSTKKVIQFVQNTKFSGQWFLANTYNIQDNLNKFQLKRGYFTLKTDFSKNISVRYTQDITLDQEGTDAGNVEIRMKFLYLMLNLKDLFIFHDNYFEFGLVNRPWINYEQQINTYRIHEKMPVEGFKIINSADFGITFVSLLGGKIDEQYQQTVNSTYPGKYGSFAVGVYNGGGYHALEMNNNKTIEARLSVRPFPSKIPGLQFTYSCAFGKCNMINSPADFQHNMFFISSESKYHAASAQYFFGKGDFGTSYIDLNGKPLDSEGYSLFGEVKIPKTKLAVFGRYDQFTVYDATNINKDIILGGIAFRFLKNKIILGMNHFNNNGIKQQVYEIALEIKF